MIASTRGFGVPFRRCDPIRMPCEGTWPVLISSLLLRRILANSIKSGTGFAIMTVWVEYIGSLAAACTTLCWVPQALKIIREKQTQGISLITQAVFTIGLTLWFIYGLLLTNWP